jgi:methionyl-tRNA formyltransferase
VSRVAAEAGIALLRPERVGDPELVDALRATAPDLGVVAAFGQFLPKKIRELPSLGYLINAHASLLPKYRGAAPIARAILGGEQRTGVSVMRIEREMDAGPVALVEETEIGPEEDTGELTRRLAQLAADAIDEAVRQIQEGCVTCTEQDHARATQALKLEREEARIDWSRPAELLVRQIRAMAPRPGAVTLLRGETLRILRARSLSRPVSLEAGRVRREEGEPLLVATGEGWLVPLRLQRAGARELEVDEFLRGRPISDAELLGDRTPSA